MPRGRPRIHADHAARSRTYRQRRRDAARSRDVPVAPEESASGPPPGDSDVPHAESEPVDRMDRVLSAVYWRAGELFEGIHQKPASHTPLQSWLLEGLSLLNQDGEMSEFLEELPFELTGGALLPTVFQALFPGPCLPAGMLLPGIGKEEMSGGERKAPERGAGGLTPREVEVLQHVAKGQSRKETAHALGWTEDAVRGHLQSLYKKLGVTHSHDAVNKAALLGIPGLTLADLVETARERLEMDFKDLSYRIVDCRLRGKSKEGWRPGTREIAALGLALFLLSPLSEVLDSIRLGAPQGSGAIVEYTLDGRIDRVLTAGGRLHEPRDVAWAPASAGPGFTPGNLFVADIGALPDYMNEDTILDLTPGGSHVRSFTGGHHFSTRLARTHGLVFTPGGRLLVANAGCNATLEFLDGGKKIRHLFHGCIYGPVRVDAAGKIYQNGGWQGDRRVRIFTPTGTLIRKVGGAGVEYAGFAIDPEGRIYMSNVESSAIEVYDNHGRTAAEIRHEAIVRPWRLAIGPAGRLYLVNEGGMPVHVLDLDPSLRVRSAGVLPAPHGYRYCGLSISPDGRLFASGRIA